MIYVTHDQVEAMTLADKIVVLRDGRVEQVGAPIELYERPANIFVAGFIGSPKMNFFDVATTSGELRAPLLGEVAINTGSGQVNIAGAKVLGIRPEHIALDENGSFNGTVKVVEQLGSVSYLYVEAAGGGTITIEQRRLTGARPGDVIRFSLETAQLHLFGEDARRLGTRP
jgi:ABC-type sugar transport system ATPase subunit